MPNTGQNLALQIKNRTQLPVLDFIAKFLFLFIAFSSSLQASTYWLEESKSNWPKYQKYYESLNSDKQEELLLEFINGLASSKSSHIKNNLTYWNSFFKSMPLEFKVYITAYSSKYSKIETAQIQFAKDFIESADLASRLNLFLGMDLLPYLKIVNEKKSTTHIAFYNQRNMLNVYLQLFQSIPKNTPFSSLETIEKFALNSLEMLIANIDKYSIQEVRDHLKEIDVASIYERLPESKHTKIAAYLSRLMNDSYEAHLQYKNWFSPKRSYLKKTAISSFEQLTNDYLNIQKKYPYQLIKRYQYLNNSNILKQNSFDDIDFTQEQLKTIKAVLTDTKTISISAVIASRILFKHAKKIDEKTARVALENLISAIGSLYSSFGYTYVKLPGHTKSVVDMEEYKQLFKELSNDISKASLSENQKTFLTKLKLIHQPEMSELDWQALNFSNLKFQEKILGEGFFLNRLFKKLDPKKMNQQSLFALQYLRVYHSNKNLSPYFSKFSEKYMNKIKDSRDNLHKIDQIWSENDFFLLKLYVLLEPNNKLFTDYLSEIYFSKKGTFNLTPNAALDWIKKLKIKPQKLRKSLVLKLSKAGNYDPKPHFAAFLELFPERTNDIAQILESHRSEPTSLVQLLEISVAQAIKDRTFLDNFIMARLEELNPKLELLYEGLSFDEWLDNKISVKTNKCNTSFNSRSGD